MLRHQNPTVSERKFRLTECAFARRSRHLLTDERSRTAVEVPERFADGLGDRDELRLAYAGAGEAFEQALDRYIPIRTPEESFWGGAVSAAQQVMYVYYDPPSGRVRGRWHRGEPSDILTEHHTGMKDSYVKRRPKIVVGACAAIEKEYFGARPTGEARQS